MMFESISGWLNGFENLRWVYIGIATVSSVLFLLLVVLSFLGGDSDGDAPDADVDADGDVDDADGSDGAAGLHLISLKTILCFFLAFGWTGTLFYGQIKNGLTLALIALAIGTGFMLLMAFVLSKLKNLAQNNVFHAQKTVGLEAEVYLRIPGGKERGKILISCEGSLHELEAYAHDEIPTGAKVLIYEAIDGSTVRVEKI